MMSPPRAVADGSPRSRWRPSASRMTSLLLVALVSSVIVLALLAFLPELLHWFLIPITLCGILVGTEAMEWLRGRTDLFDAGGLISLLAYHFFFVAPILMIVLDWRMRYLPDQPADYRPWLGAMATLNVFGLLVFRGVRALILARAAKRPPVRTRRWEIAPNRFWVVLLFFAFAGLVCQAYIFATLGGIGGYINSYTAALGGQDAFAGAGALYLVAESMPILTAIGFAVWARKANRSWALIVSVLVLLAVLEFLVGGGLRGSRSNVIWSLFWIAAILHSYVRRLPRAVAYGGILALYLFVSLYAAYKQRGADLFNSFESSGDYSALNDTAEGPATVLVADFSRADVQGYLMYKFWNESAPTPALGQTYLGALTMVIPKALWPDRPPTILKWTTDAEYGNNAYDAGLMKSSRVYGIAGEAMLNFGPLGALLAYAVFGFLVARLQLFIRSIGPGDSRLLIIPFLINTLFIVLLNDSDNTIFYLIKTGLLPVLLIVSCSQKRLPMPAFMRMRPKRAVPAKEVFA